MPGFADLEEQVADDLVALRLAAERDIPEILIAHEDDAQLHLRLGTERPPSGAELGRGADRADDDRLAGRRLTLTILETGADVCRGQIEVRDVDWEQSRAELVIWLAPQVRGRGLGQRALALASAWLVRSCRLERLQLLSELDNKAMIGAALAAGYVHEGVLRGYRRAPHGRIDAAVLSLLRADLRG